MIISHEQFANLVNTTDGASRIFRGKKALKGPGIMVSEKGAEKESTPPLTPEQAKQYYDTHAPTADKSMAHGGWKESNRIFQDKSRKYENLTEARVAGAINNQIAGYDLGGTDLRRPSGGNVYFRRRVPGVESNPEFVASTNKTAVHERMSAKPKAQEFAEQSHISRGATRMNRLGNTVPVSINEVYSTIAKNRRNRGV